MRPDVKHALASYARSFIVAVATMIAAGQDDYQKIVLLALSTAVIGPAIRAVNPNDPAFGRCALLVEQEIEKVATRSKKKVAKKK